MKIQLRKLIIQRFAAIKLAINVLLISCWSEASTLKMKTTFFSDTWTDFHLTRKRYIPEGRNVQP
jgi:hypothetical protein